LLETQKAVDPAITSITDTVKRINYQYLPARVIYNSVNKQNNFITVNKGRLQGVYPEMAVASDQGVVGIVISTSDNFASVLPILNRDFHLSAKIKRNNYFGIIEWDGRSSEIVLLKEIPVHIDIQEGDSVVTSGYSAIFPEGISVGVVESVTPSDGNFHEVKVKLATDFRNLVHVNLIRYYFKAEQESLRKDLGI
jgi:rod shape-determining protein MreC